MSLHLVEHELGDEAIEASVDDIVNGLELMLAKRAAFHEYLRAHGHEA